MRLASLLATATIAIAAGPPQETPLAGEVVEGSGGEENAGACLSSASRLKKLYWTLMFPHKIQRSDLDGSNVEDIVENLAHPQGLAVDMEGGKIYWSDSGTLEDVLQRANLDGSDVEDLLTNVNSWGLAVDAATEKLYWSDASAGRIRRANLDGSEVEDLVAEGLSEPAGLALDGRGSIYWVDQNAMKVQRAQVDGVETVEVEDLVSGLGYPQGLAVDQKNRKVYWTDSGKFRLQRANLDGSRVEDLSIKNSAGGSSVIKDPFGVAVDPDQGLLLWASAGTHYEVRKAPSTQSSSGRIQRARLLPKEEEEEGGEEEGGDRVSSAEDIVVTGRARPVCLALAVSAAAVCGGAASHRVGMRRLRVGDHVKLAADFAKSEDAARGPLRPDDIGRIAVDDHSEKPFLVTSDGKEWWYEEASLKLVVASAR